MKNKEEIMKCIVETTGSFMLLNATLEEIPSQRPCVTTMTPFVDVRINKKDIRVLARNLPNKANDKDFLEVLTEMSDGKAKDATKDQRKAAAAAYAAEFGLDIDGEKLDDVELTPEQEEEAKKAAEEKAKAEEEAKALKAAAEKGKGQDENSDTDKADEAESKKAEEAAGKAEADKAKSKGKGKK